MNNVIEPVRLDVGFQCILVVPFNFLDTDVSSQSFRFIVVFFPFSFPSSVFKHPPPFYYYYYYYYYY